MSTHKPVNVNALPLSPTDLPQSVRELLTGVTVGARIPARAFAAALEASVRLSPPIRDVVLGSVMTAVMMRGPVADEIVALLESALALDRLVPVQVISGGERPVVLMAGSGKKGVRTLNVSTPAALVAAVAGAKVIKVGSSATSSALGSRDLVRALGLPEHRTAAGVRRELSIRGFAFVAVEPEIPTLDSVYGGRFHAPNPFSFGLAPLVSPVRGDLLLFGLSHPRVDVAARVLSRLGMPRVNVVTTRTPGGHYLDEIAPVGEVRQCSVADGRVSPARSGTVHEMTGTTLRVDLPAPGSAQEAIERTFALLDGRGLRSHRLIVSLNAGYLLLFAGITRSLRDGMELADEILRSGGVLAVVSGDRCDARTE